MVRELITVRAKSQNSQTLHFDEIAQEYEDQFSPHVWDTLLERKMGMLQKFLNPTSKFGLDLGCGLGKQCLAMSRGGYEVVGSDIAFDLLHRASKAGIKVTTNDASTLPFRNDCLDFVYTVGVMHHLQGAAGVETVCREVARVLRPGGHFIVHESNPRNPLFRFYMGYIFPLLKSIDEGTEIWVDPQQWTKMPSMERAEVKYFTFLPDFIPQFLMKPALAFERWLESTKLLPYSVHYMAVLKKPE